MRKSSPRTCANGAPVTTAVTASSSRSSRRSASAGVSPSSTCPPGRSQQSGYQCRVGARCTNRPRPPRSRSPAAPKWRCSSTVTALPWQSCHWSTVYARPQGSARPARSHDKRCSAASANPGWCDAGAVGGGGFKSGCGGDQGGGAAGPASTRNSLSAGTSTTSPPRLETEDVTQPGTAISRWRWCRSSAIYGALDTSRTSVIW